MSFIYEKSGLLSDVPLSYCPGCTHGISTKLVAEVLEEMGLEGITIGVAPVGCSVLLYESYTFDMIQAPHGRAPAVATGVKRAIPENIVFTYQGDGDLAGIGMGEAVHAAARGENITVIFVNNAIYGMTGGQMAPTTLENQVTATTPTGREVASSGFPIKVSEMFATIEGTAYIERVAANSVPGIRKTKTAIKKAFQYQQENKGFSMVEILSTCPINWGLTPTAAMEWVTTNMIPYYPLGVFKERG